MQYMHDLLLAAPPLSQDVDSIGCAGHSDASYKTEGRNEEGNHNAILTDLYLHTPLKGRCFSIAGRPLLGRIAFYYLLRQLQTK